MADTPNQNNEALKTIYDQLCTSYHSVDDFRAKLLGILPLVSGVAIFNLLEKVEKPINLFPIGILGAFTTLGLLIYELKGIQKCTGYIEFGFEIEKTILKTSPTHLGHFGSLKTGRKISNVFSEPVASAFVYAAVIGAWMFVATFKLLWVEQIGIYWPAFIAVIFVFVGVIIYWNWYSKPVKSASEICNSIN